MFPNLYPLARPGPGDPAIDLTAPEIISRATVHRLIRISTRSATASQGMNLTDVLLEFIKSYIGKHGKADVGKHGKAAEKPKGRRQ